VLQTSLHQVRLKLKSLPWDKMRRFTVRGDRKNKIPAVRPKSLDTNPLPLNTAGILFPGKCLSVSVPLVIGFVAGQLRYGVVALFGSMFVAITANIDGDLRSRLLATFAAAILIMGCAELGGLFADSPGLLELGVLILAIATGWIHNSHLAIARDVLSLL
jgi:hypothetical protein